MVYGSWFLDGRATTEIYTLSLHVAHPISAAAWLGAAAFSAQIYCDFSGYTDMAIACAALLGYRLPKNFDAPYLTRTVGSFWTHWHMTLGDRKSTRLNSSHVRTTRMPSSA